MVATNLEESVFHIIAAMIPELSPQKASLLSRKIANIYWYKKSGHRQGALDAYGAFLKTLSSEEQGMYKLRAFLSNSSAGDFSSSSYDVVLHEATELLSEMEARFPSLPDGSYFSSRSNDSQAHAYLEKVETGHLYSQLQNKKHLRNASLRYEYRTRLPLTIALLAFCHLELVEGCIVSAGRNDIALEREIAWEYIEPWLGKSAGDKSHSYSHPLIPIRLLPDDHLWRFIKLGARARKIKLVNSATSFWMTTYSFNSKSEILLRRARGAAYACYELDKHKWLTEQNYPLHWKEMVPGAMEDIRREIPDHQGGYSLLLKDDIQSYLSFILANLVDIRDFERAGAIYCNWLSQCQTDPHLFLELLPSISKLLFQRQTLKADVRDQIMADTKKYAASLRGFPYIQSRVFLLLLTSSLPERN